MQPDEGESNKIMKLKREALRKMERQMSEIGETKEEIRRTGSEEEEETRGWKPQNCSVISVCVF